MSTATATLTGDSLEPGFGKHAVLTKIPSHTPCNSYSAPAKSLKVPEPPAPYFTASWHHDMDSAIKNVDQYFLDRWNFTSEKARKKFVAAGFSRVTCST